jgi:hypothetical protein
MLGALSLINVKISILAIGQWPYITLTSVTPSIAPRPMLLASTEARFDTSTFPQNPLR